MGSGDGKKLKNSIPAKNINLRAISKISMSQKILNKDVNQVF